MPLAQAPPPHAQIPGSLPYGAVSAAWPHAEHFFSDVFGASAADAVFSDLAISADFDSDGWMESLIGEAPDFQDSDLDRLIFTTPPPPVPPPAEAIAAAQAENTRASLPPVASPTQAACSSPSASDDSCSAPILQSLLACSCAEAANPGLTAADLAKVRAAATDSGDPAERVAFYFSDALARRLAPAPPATASDPRLASDELTLCYKTLNAACPYSKFAHLTANQAILEATGAATKIHIVHFGVVQGIQWAALLQALATRPEGKPSRVRISGVPSPYLGPHSGVATSTGRPSRSPSCVGAAPCSSLIFFSLALKNSHRKTQH
ncbi:hypothetical protein QYE76_063294 [Lolium multiflorum]|uniref:Uncharacterized protein n=1 Tax=Lolium multiflorum TaxID=4521 RepID=A0AAD8S584_LOLMU|nr:hypothetical protein QYE76_063294 [Lolium multiflorum]